MSALRIAYPKGQQSPSSVPGTSMLLLKADWQRGPDSHLPKREGNPLPGQGPSTNVITESHQESSPSRDLPISEKRNSGSEP